MPHLVVIYGPPFAGKTTLAREVAGSLPGKSAIVSVDAILQEAIRNPDPDGVAELDVAHTQARLLVANFLKSRYHVVLEGAFCYQRAATLHHREHEIDQTLGLMRNLAAAPVVVRLWADEATVRQRATIQRRGEEAEAALAVAAGLAPGDDRRWLQLATESGSATELAALILEELKIAGN